MNETAPTRLPLPGPACAAFADLLPLLDEETLAEDEAQMLHQHLGTCAYCQGQRAIYDRIAEALRRYGEPPEASPFPAEELLEITRDAPSAPSRPPAPFPAAPRRRVRRVVSVFSALTAVLVIALIVTALVASRRSPGTGQPAPNGTAPGASGVYFSTTTTGSSSQTFIYALNPATGSVRWRASMPSDVTVNLALVDHGVLYVLAQGANVAAPPKDPTSGVGGETSAQNAVYALRTSDGTALWERPTGSTPTAIMPGDGVVYVATEDGTVDALSASDGSAAWHAQVGAPLELKQIADGVVYVSGSSTAADGSSDDKVIALNASDGSVKWHFDMQQSAVGYVQAVNGHVLVTYAGTLLDQGVYGIAYHVVMLNASDGSVTWRYAGDPTTVGDVFIEQETIYVTLVAATTKERPTVGLQALNASDGTVRWEQPYKNFTLLDPDQGAVNGKVYLAAANTIFALNAQDGSEAWHVLLPGNALLNGLAAGMLYAQALGELYAFNPGDGSIIWRYDLGNAAMITHVTSRQLFGGGKALDPQQQWVLQLFALDARTGRLLWHYDATMGFGGLVIG